MAKKISKSGTLDKEQEAKDKEWLANKKESQHFQVGTWVVYEDRRAEVICNRWGLLVVRYEDQTIQILRPWGIPQPPRK